mgnify:CR=1 FL=1|jgi:hypothetical protein|tara:strand:- start:113 stop:700 length:588 start_codon:yes stop_codon:yes gene_type:complete
METIFTLGDETDADLKINLDDLYEKKKLHDLNTLSIYNKILARIHNKINITSRQHTTNQYCWYLIPEMMIGVPRYDHGACIAFCIDKLKDNGFMIRYTHPNLLLISWKHWVPSYVRNEVKKKTGVNIDGYGNKIIKNNNKETNDPSHPSQLYTNNNISAVNKIQYKDINSYKPTGNLIYNKDLLKRIEDKSKINK